MTLILFRPACPLVLQGTRVKSRSLTHLNLRYQSAFISLENMRGAEQRRGRGRQPAAAPAPSEHELNLAELMGRPRPVSSAQEKQNKFFLLECGRFIEFMMSQECDGTTDPLVFWPTIERQFPTLARIAVRVFATSATSADVERLFSHTGDVCTPDRSRLEPDKINKLSTCTMFLRREIGIVDKRNAASEARALRFTNLNAKREVETPTNLDELYDVLDEQKADYDDGVLLRMAGD